MGKPLRTGISGVGQVCTVAALRALTASGALFAELSNVKLFSVGAEVPFPRQTCHFSGPRLAFDKTTVLLALVPGRVSV